MCNFFVSSHTFYLYIILQVMNIEYEQKYLFIFKYIQVEMSNVILPINMFVKLHSRF